MIQIDGGFRTLFNEQIKEFCPKNNLEIKYSKIMGKYTHYVIGGETTDVQKLLDYNEVLELERENKSFWYKLWN